MFTRYLLCLRDSDKLAQLSLDKELGFFIGSYIYSHKFLCKSCREKFNYNYKYYSTLKERLSKLN